MPHIILMKIKCNMKWRENKVKTILARLDYNFYSGENSIFRTWFLFHFLLIFIVFALLLLLSDHFFLNWFAAVAKAIIIIIIITYRTGLIFCSISHGTAWEILYDDEISTYKVIELSLFIWMWNPHCGYAAGITDQLMHYAIGIWFNIKLQLCL